MTDSDLPEFRASVETELSTLLARTRGATLRLHEISGIRQFLGWHRLRFAEDLPADDLPQRLAQFILQFRDAARGQQDSPGPRKLEQALVAAALLRRPGALTIGTLRRRIAALSLVYSAADPAALRRHPAVQDALRAAIEGARQNNARRPPEGCPLPAGERARLLATCDGSSIGVRDRALLSAWFATEVSLPALVRLDHRALLDALRRCADPSSRAAAADAVGQWSDHAKLNGGPVFRRVWGSDRLGAPMSVDAARRMLRRRLALSAGSRARES